MKKIFTLLLIALAFSNNLQAQSGTEFWFAPPDVTFSHNAPGGVPIYLNISTFNDPATITIDLPANPGFTPIVVVIPANSAHQEDLSIYVSDLETAPTNTILTTGLRIVATDTITAYYEVSNSNNADIFSLKGQASLGQEFYIPLHKHEAFWNQDTYSNPNLAYASFDIVATEDNTSVTIYSPVDVDGIPALTPYTFILQQGETYSCGNTDATLEFFPYRGSNEPKYSIPANHPSGAVVISDKDIAITIKDDSNHNPSGGCYDLLGDQIVPVGIVGTEYIAVKGQLNSTGDESAFILATENNTHVFINGSTTPISILFAGQTYRYDMDYLNASADNSVYIQTSKPAYVSHVTGFGCEEGQAILPPLGCAGSEQISINRSTSEAFYLNIMVRDGNEGNFTVNGPGTAAINAASFQIVPGTGGVWRAAQIQFNTTEIPVNQAHLITNTTDVFTLAIVNGGGSSGCRYGFFSEYAAEILLDPGVDLTMCANDTVTLAGSISGGTSTGVWTSSGSGQFLPNSITLTAEYIPSPLDISAGAVTLTLTSTGNCTPVQDQINLNITPAPVVDAGVNLVVCENNSAVNLAGTVTFAASAIWTGGAGSYSPNNTSLITTYSPTPAEITAGLVNLTMTSTGNGICNAESDILQITFSDAPTIDAGANQSTCANNPDITLSGSVNIATGVIWSGGSGTFSPNVNALNAIYTPTPIEISFGTVVLTLTSTGNADCNAVSDIVTLTYTTSPTISAGTDQTLCANNADINLGGSVSIATGGIWTGGLGNYAPSNTSLTTVYSPTVSEIASGSITLTLTSTNNGTCIAVTDDILINYTAAPTANAGTDITLCANNPIAALNGNITIAGGSIWSGAAGTFTSGNNSLTTNYVPTAAEISSGSLTLTLESTINGNCIAVTDDLLITYTPSPTINAGINQNACANNPDITLSGSVTIATGGIWTGGLGTFSPNASALNAIYTATPAEILSGTLNLTFTSTGNGDCNSVSDIVTLTYTTSPTISAGTDQTLCANNANINLVGSVSIATGGIWTGGLGNFAPSNTSLTTVYSPTVSEIASGSITLTLTSTDNGTCIAVTDDILINYTAAPTADAGSDVTMCANNPNSTLNGNITISGGGVWLGGSGTFSPGNNSLTTTYTPTIGEINTGFLTLTLESTTNGNCIAVTDNILITYTPSPIVNAGPNLTACANNPDVNLGGFVQNSTGGIWSGGSGSYFSGVTDLNAVYTPTSGEITSGSFNLTLSSTGNGSCAATTDIVSITITDAPTVNAGADQTLCANNADISLNGSILSASGGVWSGGLGVFTPSNSSLNAIYTPSSTEIASGSITLTLTSTGNGTCNSETDAMTVNFTASPTADAGLDINVCENNTNASLAGIVSIATGGVWSEGSGTYSPNNNSLNAIYTPSSAEVLSGQVQLILTTIGQGNCNSEMDSVLIIINPNPIVNAGIDQTICVNSLQVSLSGSVSGITNSGTWSTSGTGTFSPNITSLNATYIASTADSISGSFILTLTSTNNANCLPVTDDVDITILPAGFADAGNDLTLCGNNANINLTGVISGGAVSGIWSSTGTGVFSPNTADLNASYIPSSFDIANGTVDLTLTSNSCNAGDDVLTVTITPAPIVNAGNDTTVCASNLSIPLNGSISGATTTGLWSSTGTGTFSPNTSDLNAIYIASAADSINQIVSIILTATNIGNCNPTTDTLTIQIFQTGIVDAGSDQILCGNNPITILNGNITGGATQGIWSTSGTGFFTPSNTDLNATYTPSAGDITLGTANLVLISTNSCSITSDFMSITFTTSPIVDAGPDLSICGTNPTINISGNITGASGGLWETNGTGTFSPSNTSLIMSYTASAADIANGGILLSLTSTGNGNCLIESDTMAIQISNGITADAGIDQIVCSTAGYAVLNGIVANGTTSGVWTTLGTGYFTPNDSVLNVQYYLSTADVSSGAVNLVLTSTFNGTCASASDTIQITFGNSVFAYAGVDQTICESQALVDLNALISGGAISGQWSTLGTGSFTPNDTTLNGQYQPSTADYINETVDLILTSTNNGGCLPGVDTLTISISPAPITDVGSDVTICNTTDSITLFANLANAVTGTWTSSGSGSFVPDENSINAHYLPSNFDLASTNFTIHFTTTGSIYCDESTDTLEVNIITPLILGFTNSRTCEGNPMLFTDTTLILSGTINSWLWEFGDGSSSISQQPIHIYATSGIFDVQLNAISSLGCEYNLVKTITVEQGPTAAFEYNPLEPTLNETVNFQDGSIDANTYKWLFGEFNATDSIQNPDYSYSSPGTYTVTEIITNSLGCNDTLIRSITVIENGIYPPAIPTGFSPNGDFKNDVLLVRGGPFKTMNLKVYNNWGNLIFESDTQNNGWDGTWKGKLLPPGDYVYTVYAEMETGEIHNFSGSISILK